MLRTFLKKFFPWVVAAGILAYLFHLYPPQKIYNTLIYMNVPTFCCVAVGYVILMYLIDTFSISRVLGHFGHEVTMRELLPARGSTYLLMIVNYAAGQAAFAFYQYRKRGLPIATMLGIFGIIVVADLFLLVLLAFITTFFTTWPFEIAGMNLRTFVRIFAVAVFGGFALLVLIMNHCATFDCVKKLRANRFIDLITTTRLTSHIKVALFRLPVHVFIMGGMFVALRAFGIDVAFIKVISNIPIVFFIGSLPITPGGLGTSNAALVELFRPFISAPAISSGQVSAGDLLFSFSLAWIFANYLMKAAIGLFCMRFVSRDLFAPTSDVSEATAEAEAAHIGGNI